MTDTLYDRVGESFFVRLVDAFYERVVDDEILRPMYPDDLSESRRHLTIFLIQYWGGPRLYSDERGHPRLRMRHAAFRVTKRARDAWLSAMLGALELLKEDLSAEEFTDMCDYFTMAANQLRNV